MALWLRKDAAFAEVCEQGLGCIGQDMQMFMGGLQGTGKDDGVFNVIMDHLVSELAQSEPCVGRCDQSEALGAVQIVCKRGGYFAYSAAPCGEQLVTQGVLQPTEAADESVDSFRQFRIMVEPLGVFWRKIRSEKPLIGVLQVRAFPLDHAR